MSLPAEKLEGLPYGWESRLVKDILVIVDGDRGSNYPKKKDFFDSGYCLFLSTKNVRPNGFLFEENQFITKERHELLRKGKLERGDIVFTSRGTIGNIAHYDERVEYDCVRINSGMFIIRGFQEHITEKYLEYYMRSPYVLSQIGRLKSGSAQPQLPIRDFQKFEINFPKDKEQQKRIVAKIEELFSHIDAGIAALKKAKQLLKQYRQSVLKAAVTGELTKEWREAHKDDAQGSANVAGGRTPGATEAKYETAQELLERILKERRQKWEEQQLEQFKANGKVPKDDRWIEKYKDPELPNTKNSEVIPESWTYCGIEMLLLPDKAAMKTGPFGSLLKKHEHKTEGVPVLGIENIASMQFVPGSKIHITNAKAKELDGYKAPSVRIVVIPVE